MAQQLSTNTFGVAKWVVSPIAYLGTHTTIASAIASASSGDVIVVQPGTYTEDLTLKSGVAICAWSSNEVTIVGKCTATTAGTFALRNLTFRTNSDFVLDVSGSAATVLLVDNCVFSGTNSSLISYSSSSGSSLLSFTNCNLNLATTGVAIFSASGAGFVNFRKCILNNTGASTTSNTMSAGALTIYYSEIYNPITTSGTASIDCRYSMLLTSNTNTTALTHGGSGTSYLTNSNLFTGTATALSISSTLNCSNVSISSSNATTIGGAGTVVYDSFNFYGTTSTISTTTQTAVANIFATSKFNDGAVGTPSITFSADTDTGIYRVGTNNMALVTAGASAIVISSAGSITQPLQPSFLATANAQTDVTGDGTTYTVLFANEIFDQAGNFSSPTFTAPITGRYLLTATIALSGLVAGHTSANAIFVASNRSVAFGGNSGVGSATAAGINRISGSVIMDMDAGDTCTITTTVSGGTKVVDIEATNTTFSGSLLC